MGSLSRLASAPARIKWWLGELRRARQLPCRLEFPYEETLVSLPRVTPFGLLTAAGRGSIHRLVRLGSRPTAEPLMRLLCQRLMMSPLVGTSDAVIDIGCWIGDNSIPWAQMLPEGTVLAVDPSAENIRFGKSVAACGQVENVIWHEGACSSTDGERLRYHGQIGHASFELDSDDGFSSDGSPSSHPYRPRSTTLDALAERYQLQRVGLLHVDVEGFELPVLHGAERIIARSQPVVIFEAHLNDPHIVDAIVDFLKSRDYRTWMINEILAGCDPDCRNFLAAPAASTPAIEQFAQDVPPSGEWVPAVDGGALIPR